MPTQIMHASYMILLNTIMLYIYRYNEEPNIENLYYMHVLNSVSSPSQVRPSRFRANPELQEQVNPPAVFRHVC